MNPDSDPEISGPDQHPRECMGAAVAWLGQLEFIQPPGVRNLRTAHPWGMRIDGVDYVVPAAMETDGMSIRRILWRLIDPPFYSLAVPGVILHDAAYGGLLRATYCGERVEVDKPLADNLLAVAARWNGYPEIKCETIYRSVAMFGAGAWRNSHARNATVDLATLDYDWTRGGQYRR